jgi:predicted RNA binding protein YcfA (HicA-like mRNA interferase family)
MSKLEKLLVTVLTGNADQNISFHELVSLLTKFGFESRIKGSHHIFYKEGITEIINLQPVGSKAKAYQIKQVRTIIQKYKLTL